MLSSLNAFKLSFRMSSTHQGTETYVSAAFDKVHNTLLPFTERSFGPGPIPILVRDDGCLETVNGLLDPSFYLHYTTLYVQESSEPE
jgi:hypothetical protein